MTREKWLIDLAKRLEVIFNENDATLPTYRVTCGFPSTGGLSKLRTLGQCWSGKSSADDTHELIVSMTLDEPMRIAGVLAHEMVHAAVGIEHGHKGPFRTLALAIGLTGKMTATEEGEAFKQRLAPILAELGDYPHAKLDASTRKKQTTRMLKIKCLEHECGMVFRTSSKWIERNGGTVFQCPICGSAAEGND